MFNNETDSLFPEVEIQARAADRLLKLVDEVTARRQPGILDRIKQCESSESAHTTFHEFLDSANAASQKTINRAQRLLSTFDFPLP